MEKITEALVGLLAAILSYMAAWLGAKIKKRLDDKTKADVIHDAVYFVEQVYVDLKGDEKLEKAMQVASEMLSVKGIKISALELRVLIESTVMKFNSSLTDGILLESTENIESDSE